MRSGWHSNCHFSFPGALWSHLGFIFPSENTNPIAFFGPLDSFVILIPPHCPVRDLIRVLSSVPISYHHQIHSLHFTSLITEPQPSLMRRSLAVELPFASHGYLGVNLFHSFLCRYNQTHYHIPVSSLYCVPLLSRLCDLFFPWKMTGSVSLPMVSMTYIFHNFLIAM